MCVSDRAPLKERAQCVCVCVSDTAPLKERGQCAPEPRASEVQRRAARRSHTGEMQPHRVASRPTPQLQPPGAYILLTANGEPDRVVSSELTQTELTQTELTQTELTQTES